METRLVHKTSWLLQHSSFLTHYGAYRRRHFHFSTTHSTSHHHELNTTFFLLSLLCALAFLVRAQTPSDNFNEINRRKSKARKRVCMQKKILRRKQWEEFLVSLILNRLAVIASSYGEVIKAVASVIIYAFIDDICIFGNSKEKYTSPLCCSRALKHRSEALCWDWMWMGMFCC